MPSDGKLQITHSTPGGFMNVDAFTGYCGSLSSESYLRDGSGGNLTVTTLKKDQEVYIAWQDVEKDAEWDIAIMSLEAGDNKGLAIEAVPGINTIPTLTANPNPYWYRYVMPTDGKLQISSESSSGLILSEKHGIQPAISSKVVTGLEAGDEIFIRYYLEDVGNIDWTLATHPSEVGDFCEMAALADSGTNRLPAVEEGLDTYWYHYTMPEEGDLKISSSTTNHSVTVYANSCSDLVEKGEGYNGEVTIEGIEGGEEVWIRWSSHGGGDFDWDLIPQPYEEGDNCKFAADAVLGNNHLPVVSEGQKYYWYQYTMPSDSKLKITSSSESEIEIYGNAYACEGAYPIHSFSPRGNIIIPSLERGEKIWIRWDVQFQDDFEWEIVMLPLEAGDNCENPANAVLNDNSLPAVDDGQEYYWYHYTLPQGDHEISITSSSSSQVSVNVYSNTCDNLIYEEGNYSGNVVIPSISSGGNKVWIRWGVYNGGNFDWNLEVTPNGPLPERANCTNAAQVNLGDSTDSVWRNTGSGWYRYIMPKDGKIDVRPEPWDYGGMYVYSGTCGDLITEGYAFSATSSVLRQGDEVFINSGISGNWELSIADPEAGETCELAVAAVLGENKVPNPHYYRRTVYWHHYRAPSDGRLEITSDQSHALSLWTDACENAQKIAEGSGDSFSDLLSEGEKVWVRWDYFNEQNTEDSDWNLSFVPLVPPVAQAGADQTLTDEDNSGTESVILDGSASSDDVSIVSYVWKKGETELATGESPTVDLVVGAHTITLVVTDDAGLTASDEVVVTVKAPQPPTAQAGADQTLTDEDNDGTEAISLDGTASSDERGIANYSWKAGETQVATGVTPTVVLPVGSHTLTLIVTASSGLTSSDEVVIVIEPFNYPPSVSSNAGLLVQKGSSVVISSSVLSAEDTESAASSLVFTLRQIPAHGTLRRSGSPLGLDETFTQEDIDENLLSYIHAGNSEQDDSFSFFVTDASNKSTAETTFTISITLLSPPIASAGPDQQVVDTDNNGTESVILDGSASSDDVSIVSYVWKKGETELATGESPNGRFSGGRSYDNLGCN